jgi:hypothetical protein
MKTLQLQAASIHASISQQMNSDTPDLPIYETNL